MRSKLLFPLLILVSSFLFSACSSLTKLEQFNTLKPGMEKHDVLEVMGGPDRRQRIHGSDRWTYLIYDQNIRNEKVVEFNEGIATHVGDRVPPAVSAGEQDSLNEAANKVLEKDFQKRREDAREALKKYEDSNTPGADAAVPTFEPVR
jgi:outer membrane protein assembly factor BamE